jgi:competence ComEA-like helix-hairpin-helix protein
MASSVTEPSESDAKPKSDSDPRINIDSLDSQSGRSPWVHLIFVLVMLLICMIGYRGSVLRDQIKPAPNHWKMDINHADGPTLELLPMIGPSLAQGIIDYRAEHGPFINVEQLDKVKRIGPVTLARLSPLIVCGLPTR